jgi:hypothetical protein
VNNIEIKSESGDKVVEEDKPEDQPEAPTEN